MTPLCHYLIIMTDDNCIAIRQLSRIDFVKLAVSVAPSIPPHRRFHYKRFYWVSIYNLQKDLITHQNMIYYITQFAICKGVFFAHLDEKGGLARV